MGTCVPSTHPITLGKEYRSENLCWLKNCPDSFGKTMKSLSWKQSASDTVQMHRDTDG